MTVTAPRERVIRTLAHQAVDRVACDAWIPPKMRALGNNELREFLLRFLRNITRWAESKVDDVVFGDVWDSSLSACGIRRFPLPI